MDFRQGGQVIQRIRKEHGMTQEQLAEKVGIDPSSISRIERGRLIPALPTLIDICNALEIGSDAVLAAYIAVDTPARLGFRFCVQIFHEPLDGFGINLGQPFRWAKIAGDNAGHTLIENNSAS